MKCWQHLKLNNLEQKCPTRSINSHFLPQRRQKENMLLEKSQCWIMFCLCFFPLAFNQTGKCCLPLSKVNFSLTQSFSADHYNTKIQPEMPGVGQMFAQNAGRRVVSAGCVYLPDWKQQSVIKDSAWTGAENVCLYTETLCYSQFL